MEELMETVTVNVSDEAQSPPKKTTDHASHQFTYAKPAAPIRRTKSQSTYVSTPIRYALSYEDGTWSAVDANKYLRQAQQRRVVLAHTVGGGIQTAAARAEWVCAHQAGHQLLANAINIFGKLSSDGSFSRIQPEEEFKHAYVGHHAHDIGGNICCIRLT